MKVGIIGCGLIGRKRAKALAGASLVACADIVPALAQQLADSSSGAAAYSDWRQVIDRDDVEIVIVATTHDQLAAMTHAAVRAGKHVLVEKPAARSAQELEPILSDLTSSDVQVRVGFNHRYHPSFQKAHELFETGALGEMMYIRGRYGHGGRPGYDKEWRADRAISGGGELTDQGVHLIDLSRWFLGDFVSTQGFINTYFWDMPVEDNGFLLLRTAQNQVAFLHTSWTEWKNLFSFEVFGRDAKLEITGLGGSYGTERLAYYRMLPEMGPPETTIWEYPMADQSWSLEFSEFLEDIRLRRTPAASLNDAYQALKIVNSVYQQSLEGQKS
jgi:predicted dehydrogenase